MVDWPNSLSDGFPIALIDAPPTDLAGQGGSRSAAIPDVRFGPPAERINPTNRELAFIVPLTDGPVYLGDVNLIVSPRDELSVASERLLQMLKPLLKADVFSRLTAAVDDHGRLSAVSLEREAITLNYNARTLTLTIDIPTAERAQRSISLGAQVAVGVETLAPAGFSGFLNIRAATNLAETGPDNGFSEPTAGLDAAVRIKGLVAEFEGFASARKGDPAFRRTGSRLVYDDVRTSMRWTLGDTPVAARQFQASPTAFGLGVSRIYSQLDPQREIRATGTQSFSVLGQSMIETFVNGRSVERRSIQPGTYSLQDFPLADGANRVQLRIEDATGKIRQIDFSLYANQSLLAKGLTEFSAFGGVYAQPSRRSLDYSSRWIAGGFVRTGLSERVTAGANVQANARVRQAGVEVLWASPIGLNGFSIAASDATGRGTGLAAALTYQRLLSHRGGAQSQSLRASIEWRSKEFEIPDVLFGPPASELRASAGYVVTLRENTFVAADLDYTRDRYNAAPSYGGRLSGGWSFGRLAATAELGFARGLPRKETFLRLGLRMRLGNRGAVQLETGSDHRTRFNISSSGGDGNGGWFGSADLSRDRNAMSLNANGNLITNRAELGIQQTVNWERAGIKLNDARTSFRAATGIAFAGGVFAIGRPVNQAFVIAAPHRTLGAKTIYLDPTSSSEAARTGSLGPALLGQLGAYSFRTLAYQVPEAPAGYDLGAGNIAIKPPYRSGYKLVVGSDYNLLAVGRLLDRNGEPISLLAGQATDLGNPKRPAMTVFTSRDGRFGAQGFRAGRWRIVMPTPRLDTFEFDVIETSDGTVRLGDLLPITSERNHP